MSSLGLASRAAMPGLYARIGYEPALEALAFRRLGELDVEGCRAALGRLVDQLDPTGAADRPRDVVLLLLDVLQRLNRRLYRPPDEDAAYQVSRIALIEQFSEMVDPQRARKLFMPAVIRLLAPLKVRPASAHPLVGRAQAYIEDHYQSRVGLSSVARQLNISPSYLSRLFRREVGITLTEYTHKVRLEHARLLLAAGDHSISEVAYVVGYQTYRDFYRNFVKYERTSPRKAKKRIVETQRPPDKDNSEERPA